MNGTEAQWYAQLHQQVGQLAAENSQLRQRVSELVSFDIERIVVKRDSEGRIDIVREVRVTPEVLELRAENAELRERLRKLNSDASRLVSMTKEVQAAFWKTLERAQTAERRLSEGRIGA
jgi:cell division protein FtsB